jgi:hypothetical protein
VSLSATSLLRLLVLAIMALHVFVMYCTARDLVGEPFGFDLGTSILACVFSLAMLLPFVWIVGLPDLPDYLRLRRRWKRDQCTQCGYQLRGGNHLICSECGAIVRPPVNDLVQPATICRFALIVLAAWLAGAAGGETWIQLDEAAFLREAEAATSSPGIDIYSRDRRWPGGSQRLIYRRGRGVLTEHELMMMSITDDGAR